MISWVRGELTKMADLKTEINVYILSHRFMWLFARENTSIYFLGTSTV